MPRAFPLPVNIGTDICKISRVEDILTKHQSKYAHRFIRRVFTPQEQVWYRPRLLPLIEYLYFMERREFIQGKIEKQQRWKAKSLEALIGLVAPKETPLLKSTAANDEPVGSVIWSPYTAQENPKKLTKEEEESVLIQLRENVQGVARFVAGRFAAKEAAKKAFSKRQLTFHDITIDNPSLDNLRSRAPITLIRATTGFEDQIVPMSISHDGDYATAVCMSCEDVAPPTTPDLQEIQPNLARLLDEMTIKRLSLHDSHPLSSGKKHEWTLQDSTSKDTNPEKSLDRFSTPLQKIPTKFISPITGRLSEIMNSTPGGGSNIPTLDAMEDLNISEASSPVQPVVFSSPVKDSEIQSNLNTSEVPNIVHSEASFLSTQKSMIRYHMWNGGSAFNSINVDLQETFDRNAEGFQTRDYSKGSRSIDHRQVDDPQSSEGFTPPHDDGSISQPRSQSYQGTQTNDYQPSQGPQTIIGSAQPSDNRPVPRPGDWICKSVGCGFENSVQHRKCVKCGTKRLEGWANYIDVDNIYNIRLAQNSNHTALPIEIDPAKEEERRLRVANRHAKLETRMESTYGLPSYLDPKIIKKNVENCLRVQGVPVGTTNEELVEAFKGRCTAMKGYVKMSRDGHTEGWVILSRKTEANKLRNQSKRKPQELPMIRNRRLKLVATDEWLRGILRDYASGTRVWDWRADFWTTDVFHPYDKEECEKHAQRRADAWEEVRAEEQRVRKSTEAKDIKKLKKLEKSFEKKQTSNLLRLIDGLKSKLNRTSRAKMDRKLKEMGARKERREEEEEGEEEEEEDEEYEEDEEEIDIVKKDL
ncbi:6ea8abcc-fb25-4009-8bb6-6d495f5f0ea4 [Sclerotinia trifoliorum]|uniref:6ea8abcc-fb25-4009-8bb6-6d495f5f0ea4 n=1 Tax=Sclerotinia trifoliorum TaxID=28548 RepID=A0A8H2ZU25_9HELO|nr:6ea8abcc-fb25-4009-8bb6-6d495f5f0ea4 [Sclerotinia trifoliorum]